MDDPEQKFVQEMFSQYKISNTHGCILSTVPELPERFNALLKIARNLPELIEKKDVRSSVEELQMIETDDLIGYELLRHAHLAFVMVTGGYVWQNGEAGIPKCIPKQLAVPLADISRKVELSPIICHADLVLTNVELCDPSRPFQLGNIKLKYRMSGDLSCDWFFLATAGVELALIPAFKTILACQWCIENKLVEKVKTHLHNLTGIIDNLRDAFLRMHEQLDVDKFYNTVRPYLNGWHTDGMVYEGVSEQPIKAHGGSAAQCSGIQALDIFLGIQHQQDKMDFLLSMRDYMPGASRRFLTKLESICRTSSFVADYSSEDEGLVKVYNKCVESMVSLRSKHIQMVTKYITVPKYRSKTEKFGSLRQQGTGGQDLLPFLKNIRSSTQSAVLPDP